MELLETIFPHTPYFPDSTCRMDDIVGRILTDQSFPYLPPNDKQRIDLFCLLQADRITVITALDN